MDAVTIGRMLTLEEVCRALQISTQTGYNLIRDERFPLRPVLVGGRYRFSPGEFERLLAGEQA